MNKYISVAIDKLAVPIIMMFPGHITHIEMAKAMRLTGFPTVLSAGFIDEFLQCYGESSSLRISSKEGDTKLLHSQLSIDDKKIKL
jgi:hypothetical protein